MFLKQNNYRPFNEEVLVFNNNQLIVMLDTITNSNVENILEITNQNSIDEHYHGFKFFNL